MLTYLTYTMLLRFFAREFTNRKYIFTLNDEDALPPNAVIAISFECLAHLS